jgi:hypothetical protein
MLLNMSSSPHPETDGLTERVSSMYSQILRCFYSYDGLRWTNMQPFVEFAYNVTRALGIEHTPFHANFGFSPTKEPPYMSFGNRHAASRPHNGSSSSDDDDFKVSQHISDVCVKSLLGRRGKYLLFMTPLSEDDIPLVWHRLNEVHRATALQNFMETPQWHKFARTRVYHDCMHAHSTRIHESQKPLGMGAKTTVEVGITASLIHLSRGKDTSVTSIVL